MITRMQMRFHHGRQFTALLIVVLLLGIVPFAAAQETALAYVTTQDFVALRHGPGRAFERITVVPPEVTLPAYGRSSDTQWIQVEYEGQRGWIASILLVWSGDVINLPVDGVDPEPFIRRAAALGMTTRETPIYPAFTHMLPQYQVGTIPEGVALELTGRVGEIGYFRFQVRYEGQLYWVGSWDIRLIDGDYRRLLDLAYLFPYGRLVQSLEENLALALSSYTRILSVWQRLQRGDRVACDPLPGYVERTLTDGDVLKEPLFAPVIVPLDNAVTAINRTISVFEDACTTPGYTLTPETINTQLAELASAQRNLILAGSLLEPLRARNPLLDSGT